jgi:hypothetical protein
MGAAHIFMYRALDIPGGRAPLGGEHLIIITNTLLPEKQISFTHLGVLLVLTVRGI